MQLTGNTIGFEKLRLQKEKIHRCESIYTVHERCSIQHEGMTSPGIGGSEGVIKFLSYSVSIPGCTH